MIYHEALFAPLIAEQLGLSLLDPPDNWLARLSSIYAQRWIQFATMGVARKSTKPQFVKPPNDKSFAAMVYETGLDLPSEPEDLAPVLIAEPVRWLVEFRCFVADCRLAAMSPYLEDGILLNTTDFQTSPDYVTGATDFVKRLLADPNVDLPRAVVVDIGYIEHRDWAVIELNPAYSSGIYGCDADSVLDVLALSVSASSHRA